ncbi:F-box/kelch-repeat protein At3g06240-like [Apium graveolens]|uniref:F-box/kelch-repeat protein At3g06240-like n=1 Tax=Apium graveolens TaxID=4045 RepID=UPI003D7B8F9C
MVARDIPTMAKKMATRAKRNLNELLPEEIINNIFLEFSVKDLLRLRSVCKSWLFLISSPNFVKTHVMIMYNIFLRLSVHDLLRLRSVCKSWLSIISSRDFIKTRLIISTRDPQFTYHRLLLGGEPLDFAICSVYSLLREPYTERRLDYSDESLLDELLTATLIDSNVQCVVGCCNGLVCLASNDGHAIFWNPATRQSRRLPKPDTIDHFRAYNGFCYDELNDDYKVIFIYSCSPWPGRSDYKVSVYSSKSDCWRLIGDFPFLTVSLGGEFADGAMHWKGRNDTEKENVIVSFDIITEEYQDILLPEYGEDENHVTDWTMDTFGGNLSVLLGFRDIRRDFWVMKERDVKEPWTKLFSIPYNIDGLTNSFYISPIYISVNGDILIYSDTTIVVYNSEDQTLKGLPDGYFQSLSVFSYVESLVSPHL